jgi:hypothetical protein
MSDPTAGGAAADILTRDELRQLAEIGFLACGARNVRAAQAIFEALRVLQPERAYPYLGLAMARMSADDPDGAVRILREQGLPLNPLDEDLHVFLGIALRAAKRRGESDRVLGNLLAVQAPDSPERRLARAMLVQPASGVPRPAAVSEPEDGESTSFWT